jgi:hypothetical protein
VRVKQRCAGDGIPFHTTWPRQSLWSNRHTFSNKPPCESGLTGAHSPKEDTSPMHARAQSQLTRPNLVNFQDTLKGLQRHYSAIYRQTGTKAAKIRYAATTVCTLNSPCSRANLASGSTISPYPQGMKKARFAKQRACLTKTLRQKTKHVCLLTRQ